MRTKCALQKSPGNRVPRPPAYQPQATPPSTFSPSVLTRSQSRYRLHEQPLLHIAEDVSQAEVSASVAIGEAFVVDAEGIQQTSVEVVHMDRIGHRRKTNIVGGSIG